MANPLDLSASTLLEIRAYIGGEWSGSSERFAVRVIPPALFFAPTVLRGATSPRAFRRDLARVWNGAEARAFGVNAGMISTPEAPFGGLKTSGFGPARRENKHVSLRHREERGDPWGRSASVAFLGTAASHPESLRSSR